MSASREKKKRQNQSTVEAVENGVSKKNGKKGLKKVLYSVIAVIVVAAIVFLGMVSTGFFAKHGTAAVASGHKLSPAVVNYFYGTAYTNNQQMLSYFTDSSTPLDEQAFGGDTYETWADYLMDTALNSAAQMYAIYDKAVANGYTLSEESEAEIENQMQMYELYASVYGYNNIDTFLASQFGSGCTADSYREYLTVNTLAQEYMNSVSTGLTYTQDEINAYYSAHAEDFDAVTYRVFNINVDAEAEDTDAAMAACEEAAKAMAEASQGDEAAFLELARENTADEDQDDYDAAPSTVREDYVKASTSEAYRDWLFDAARQTGDTTYVQNGDTGYSVVYFVENVDHSYQLPNVRHILVYVSDTTDADAMATAKEEAQAILDEYLAGDQTEEAFAALADEKSYDSAEGGLIENVAPGAYVQNFEDWCYDESRQVGDTGIIESEYGYHVMLFCGYGQTYQDYSVENTMRNNDYSEWYSNVTADASYTTNAFFMRFTNN